MAVQNTFTDFNLEIFVKTRKELVMTIALVFTSALLIVLGFQQGLGGYETYGQIQKEQKKLDQLNKKIQELELVKVSTEFSQADEVNEVLPSHKPLLELLNNLNNVASTTLVSINQFEVRPGEIATDSTKATGTQTRRLTSQENAAYDKLNLELKIEGQLKNVQTFMNLIERVAPFTTIVEITLDQKGEVGDPEAKAQATLVINTYFYTQSIASTISSPLPKITDRERNIFNTIMQFTPAGLKQQTTIIEGNQTDLFGIEGLSVKDLQQVIQTEQTE